MICFSQGSEVCSNWQLSLTLVSSYWVRERRWVVQLCFSFDHQITLCFIYIFKSYRNLFRVSLHLVPGCVLVHSGFFLFMPRWSNWHCFCTHYSLMVMKLNSELSVFNQSINQSINQSMPSVEAQMALCPLCLSKYCLSKGFFNEDTKTEALCSCHM